MTLDRFTDTVSLITGSSRGIGFAIARRIVAEGAPADVVTEETVAEVFGLASRVVPDPVSGTPMVVPIGRHRAGAPDPLAR